jgi:hypothetical protein
MQENATKTTKPKPLKTEQVQAVDRQRQALELRKLGYSYERIAAALDYASASGAWHAVRRGIVTTLQEPADALRGLELSRLDELHGALWPRAIAGNLRAIDGVLSIMRRRAALLGLDAPRRHHVEAHIPLRAYAEQVAADTGLDVGSIIVEAERILKQIAENDGSDRWS